MKRQNNLQIDHSRDVETFLKFSSADSKDIEAALKIPAEEATSA